MKKYNKQKKNTWQFYFMHESQVLYKDGYYTHFTEEETEAQRG